jgi:DNA-directed RNA polymerase sigma subunit (sigma70/sigma32)
VLAHDQQAESAGQRLVEGSLSMVVAIAEQHRSSGIHVFDLIIKGNDGLLVALNTFGGSSGESFSSHAAKCVEQAISKAIAESRLPLE